MLTLPSHYGKSVVFPCVRLRVVALATTRAIHIFHVELLWPEPAAHGGAPACPALLRGLAGRLGRGLHLLGKEGMLGNGEENERRSALVEQLQRLLTAGGEAEAAARLRRIVSLTRAERARHLSPFRP